MSLLLFFCRPSAVHFFRGIVSIVSNRGDREMGRKTELKQKHWPEIDSRGRHRNNNKNPGDKEKKKEEKLSIVFVTCAIQLSISASVRRRRLSRLIEKSLSYQLKEPDATQQLLRDSRILIAYAIVGILQVSQLIQRKEEPKNASIIEKRVECCVCCVRWPKIEKQ